MNTSKINSFRIMIAAMCLVLAVLVATPKVYAQDDDGYGGCDCQTGYSTDSATPSYDDSGYSTDSATPSYSADDTGYYTDSATPSYDDSGYYTDSATPSYDDSGYSTDSATPSYSADDTGYYTDSATPSYSSNPSYGSDYDSSNCGCSTGSTSGSGYTVTNPSYGSTIYSTPGTGYSSGNIFTTAGTGYSVSPIYTPAPVYHTTTPTPIVYNTPVAQPAQQQQQQQTSTTQPIIINNTNTNTNTNPNTNTVTNYAPVTVATPQPVVDYVYPATCTITASSNGTNGTILSWTSNYGSTANLSNVGSVPTNGSYVVYPAGTMNYILTVYSTQGTSGTCNVTVAPSIPNSSVSLTQIPYTGFDFGTFGDAIYWAALMAFAVASAYLLVYYRGGAFTLATAMMGRSSIQPMRFTEAEEETVETTHEPIEAPAPMSPVVNTRIASVIQNLPAAVAPRMTRDAMVVNHSTNGSAPRIVITRE